MRSRDEVRGVVEAYATSGMRRREYCEKHGISISTLDYWRRRQPKKPKLIEVAIERPSPEGFALVLTNGRRIESSWRFTDADLLRLMRVAEG